jgi:hypothetical protein
MSDAENSKGTPWLQPYNFKPGQSGNPGGRPSTKRLTEEYRKMLDKPFPGREPMTYAEVIAERVVMEAAMGTRGGSGTLSFLDAAAELADRIEGKPQTKGELTGAHGESLFQPLERKATEARILEIQAAAQSRRSG